MKTYALSLEEIGDLLVRPTQQANESGNAFALRLAHQNGLRRAIWLMQRCGLRPVKQLRVCPCCTAESIAHWPIEWESADTLWCSKHGVWLVDQCPACNGPLSWSKTQFEHCRCGYTLSKLQSVEVDPAMLTECATKPDLVSTLLWFGAVAVHGFNDKPRKHASSQQMSAVARYLMAGWEIYANWPVSFTALLVKHRQPPSAENTIQSFREAFPGFLRVLTGLRNQEWRSRVLDSVTAYTSSTHGTSQAIHGREAFHDRGLNQSTVARSLGVSTTTLSQMLRDDASLQHLRRTTSGGRTRRLIPEATINSLKHSLHDRISEKAAASMLGLKPVRVQHLVSFGFLELNKGCFSADEVQTFANRFLIEAQSKSAERFGWVPLADALRLHIPNHLTGKFFSALLSKTIGCAAPSESTRLRSLVIQRDHLHKWRAIELDAVGEWFTIPEAASKLGLKEQVTYELVSAGLLKFERRRLKSRTTRAISAHSISCFEQNYVSLSSLMTDRDVYPKSVYAWALDAGLCVVSGPLVDGTRQYFVKRSETSPRKIL